ncbi:methyltransferase [Actinoplanes sp. SE50]|uniref:protein-L-isoaspartate O-methyltransferase family protein n=1 Tax=unclassified Actinoplanes TaxID=2626549 RepID=UPI00023EBFCF|nr:MULTISPECIES: methyltransferase domain-containing protein [unclassified Actinoplanes]AEV87491.1 protein-L-isoaspartate(D-aspartate) O-methyltransferase [Actinoplanes sp. SE50/110]ATO85894.1 methyltransferase [Actinoplanes sp. SE50]SLM03308.1 methyltransferase [Actinoplanes sp. SE50/110]
MTDLRRRYIDLIRQDGVSLSPELATAFGSVPRELFVTGGFHRRDGSWMEPVDPDFLPTVYSNDVLVTKVDGDRPISSSSQPSLMAIMLAALDVRPGMRILEIGAGTGYNAALLATLGAEVTSVEVQEDVAAHARAALARAGISRARVVTGDGYPGSPDARYDRVIVTVGVAGLSPHWFAQLDPAGFVVAPVEHAGHHPVLTVTGSGTGRVVCSAGFMGAAGPLGARHPGSHPPPAGVLHGLTETAPPRWDPPLDSTAYRDLWYAAGAWDRRVTRATLPAGEVVRRDARHAFRSGEDIYLTLLDETGTGGAVLLPDGSVLAGGGDADRRTADAAALIDRWHRRGRPPMRAWQVGLTRAGDPDAPILVPTTWQPADD